MTAGAGSIEFETFQKIPRLIRTCVITEKLDGTNGQIYISEQGDLYAGSRNRWVLTPEGLSVDNYGFGQWALTHRDELVSGLGIGRHFGEWWGRGIGCGYGLDGRRFSLFNTSLWSNDTSRPSCCRVVPVLWEGVFDSSAIQVCVDRLRAYGSVAAPGFMAPEGIVVYHSAARIYFKQTLEKDSQPKGML